ILAYETVKTVQIRDWRLGLLHYLLEIAIFCYILYEIIVNTRYIAKSPVIGGSVRLQAQLNSTALASATPPSYCTNDPAVNGCLFWNEKEIVYPAGTDFSIFLTTRVTMTTYDPASPDCASGNFSFLSTASDFRCSAFSKSAVRQSYYIPYVENITLLLDHAARSSLDSPVILPATSMVGKLYNTAGKEQRNINEAEHAENIKKNINGDILTVGEILRASGADLNALSGAPGAGATETQRRAGIVISFLISYQNRESSFKDINNVALKYKYYPAAVPRTEYKVEQVINNPNGTVTILNRHGIFLSFDQTGEIGTFSFIALLTNLVAALALLKITSLIVDALMTMVFPQRDVYKEAKFQVTEDLGKLPNTP
ncbi:cytochrome c oxidase subunit 1, partial [Phlyctochytrium bullatum]